jgi:hypothetical protein
MAVFYAKRFAFVNCPASVEPPARCSVEAKRYDNGMRRKKKEKNLAAVILGQKGGKARLTKMTKAERQDSARKAAKARWQKLKK